MTKRVKDTLQIFAVIFAAVLLLRVFVLAFALVPTRSMVPAILPGDYVFINKMAYSFGFGNFSINIFDIKRNDIVAIDSKLVKRIAGMPGDSLIFSAKESYFKLNNRYYPCYKSDSAKIKIPYEGYKIFTSEIEELHSFYKKSILRENIPLKYSTALFDSTESDIGLVYSYTFKENFYMLLGDNSDYSRDSREFGFIPQSEIMGRVEFVYFSVDSGKGNIRFERIGKVL